MPGLARKLGGWVALTIVPSLAVAVVLVKVWKQDFLEAFFGAAGTETLASLIYFGLVYLDPLLNVLRRESLAGLRATYPVANYPIHGRAVQSRPRERAKAQKEFRQSLGKYTALRIMLSSGFDYIGVQASDLGLGTLGDAIADTKQPLNIELLLLDPDSPVAAARDSSDSRGPTGWYSNGIRAVIQQVGIWKKANPQWKISVGLYSEEPIWQMVILGEREMWLLCAARGVLSSVSPVYRLSLNTPYGLAWGLVSVFDRRRGLSKFIDPADPQWAPKGALHDIRRRVRGDPS